MDSFKTSTITKWHRVSKNAVDRVSKRLKSIQALEPKAAARIVNFGWSSSSTRSGFATLRLELLRLNARNLSGLSLSRDQVKNIETQLFSVLENWERLSFVHGDLSLRNILVTPAFEVWFTDWILDLESFEATPLFASPDVYRGLRTPATDRYSAEQILKSYRPSWYIKKT